MPTIVIEYDYSAERSEEVAERSGNGSVTKDGSYRRSIDLNLGQYQAMRNYAEKDDEATIVEVEL